VDFFEANINSNSKFINPIFLNKQFRNWIDPMSASNHMMLQYVTALIHYKQKPMTDETATTTAHVNKMHFMVWTPML